MTSLVDLQKQFYEAGVAGTLPIAATGDATIDGDLTLGKSLVTGGELAPDVDEGGVCINHGANDGNALTLKNSDVAHGMTALTETDTYASLSKASGGSGGLFIKGFTEGITGIDIDSKGTGTATSDTDGGTLYITSAKKSGTGQTSFASGDNILSVANNDVIKVVVKGNGDIVTQGGVRVNAPLGLRIYTVATLPTVGNGEMIFVSDETGGAVPAFSDGTNWRRVTDRVIVS